MKNSSKAFSLLELSVVIFIIAIIVLGAILGKYLLDKSRLTNARALTQSSPVLSIDNGPVIWYESSLDRSFNTAQQVNGMPVSGWYNITNNGTTIKIDAVQSTSNNQPTYANTINSVPAVRFDGTNSYFNFDGSFLNNSDYTIFVVESRESNKADNYFFGDNAVTTTNQNLVLGYSANNQIIHKQGSGNTYTSNIAPYDTNHSPKIFTFTQDSNNGKNTYINSYHTGTSNDATQLQNIGTVTLAKSYQGQIGELIIFPRALTTNERQDVEFYLANKWSIDTPLKNGANASTSTDCTSGTLIGNVCDSGTCNVAITGISTTTVSNGSGSLNCDTGYTGGPVTYTCSHSALSSSGSCTATTCTITGQTGLANQSGLAYTTTPTALTCQSGYSGSPTYTCTSSGAATISGSCTPITCSITSQTGLANQTGLAYTTTPTALTCQSGYSGSPTYTCTSTGDATISGSCTAITCSITSQTGLANQSGLAYASSATAIPGGCSSGYTGSPTYTCTSIGAATIVSGCTAITCTITSVTGLNNKTGLAYAASATAVPSTPTAACATGYSGSPTYTCTSTGAATIVSGCTAATCAVSVTGVSSPSTVNNGTGTLTCNATGYNSSTFSYTCSGGATITGSNCNNQCGTGYYWNGSTCAVQCYINRTDLGFVGYINQGSTVAASCNYSNYVGTLYWNCDSGGNASFVGGSCNLATYHWSRVSVSGCNIWGNGWGNWTCDATTLNSYIWTNNTSTPSNTGGYGYNGSCYEVDSNYYGSGCPNAFCNGGGMWIWQCVYN